MCSSPWPQDRFLLLLLLFLKAIKKNPSYCVLALEIVRKTHTHTNPKAHILQEGSTGKTRWASWSRCRRCCPCNGFAPDIRAGSKEGKFEFCLSDTWVLSGWCSVDGHEIGWELKPCSSACHRPHAAAGSHWAAVNGFWEEEEPWKQRQFLLSSSELSPSDIGREWVHACWFNIARSLHWASR